MQDQSNSKVTNKSLKQAYCNVIKKKPKQNIYKPFVSLNYTQKKGIDPYEDMSFSTEHMQATSKYVPNYGTQN